MKLSTKGRYGLRALADLAAHADGKPVSVISIAQRQNLSDNYLENMFATLKKAGIVRSVKGVGGGYLLAREASDIRVGEVLTALEGDLSIIEADPSDTGTQSLKHCIDTHVWDVVSDRIRKVVGSVTLQDLVEAKNA